MPEPEFDSLSDYREQLPEPDFSGFDFSQYEGPSIGRQSPDQLDGQYSICSIESEVLHDSGKRQMRVGAATGLARSVTVSAPSTKRIISFHMRRRGLAPLVPAPYPASANEVLETANISTADVCIAENLETLEYDVRGRYVFFLLDGTYPVPDTGIQAPVAPWTLVELSEALIAVEQFKTGMF